MSNNSIPLSAHEREIIAEIWAAPNNRTETDRLLAIEASLGKQIWFTRGWCRLHFGPPGGRPIVRRQRPADDVRRENENRYAYVRSATGAVMNVGMNYLSDLVIRPGIEKKFGPLLLYMGAMNRGRAHRLWNFVLLMMAAEAETLSDGLKLIHNPAFAQLCGPVRAPIKTSLWSFFFRLYDNPLVTKNIEGLTEYVKMMGADQAWRLRRVDRFTDRINCAEWRVSTHENAGQDYRDRERGVPQSQQLFYPFMVHNPTEPDGARDLVLLVNQAVPDRWPEQIRADVCQEMIVGLLSGDIAVGELRDSVQKYWQKHFKTLPQQYGEGGLRISFDAPVPGTDDMPWTDRI